MFRVQQGAGLFKANLTGGSRLGFLEGRVFKKKIFVCMFGVKKEENLVMYELFLFYNFEEKFIGKNLINY